MTDFSQLNSEPRNTYSTLERAPFGPAQSESDSFNVSLALGRFILDGYIVCDGPGDIRVQIGIDNTAALAAPFIRIKFGERFNFAPLKIGFIIVSRDTTGVSKDTTAYRSYFF